MTYTKEEIKAAAQNLEECASTWAWETEEQFFAVSSTCWAVNEQRLAEAALEAVLDARRNPDYPDTFLTYYMLEAAALLRGGWLPGEPLERL